MMLGGWSKSLREGWGKWERGGANDWERSFTISVLEKKKKTKEQWMLGEEWGK